jgi:hypothetical protein
MQSKAKKNNANLGLSTLVSKPTQRPRQRLRAGAGSRQPPPVMGLASGPRQPPGRPQQVGGAGDGQVALSMRKQ